MIAYNKIWLDNLYLHNQLKEAVDEKCITEAELENCKKNYPVGFYSPNFFIRIGLFLLTAIIASFAFGFCSMLIVGTSSGFGGVSIFFAIISYVVLEVLSRSHFRSGVDDSLIWISAIFIFAGIEFIFPNMSSFGNSVLIFVIASYFTLRFVDTGMAVIACLSLLGIFFFWYIRSGDFAKSTAPFLMMVIAGLIYFISQKRKIKMKAGIMRIVSY